PATACSAPLAQPERTGLTARRVTLHRTASEPLDRSSPGTGVLVRIDQRNRCTLSGVAHRQVARQGFPCAALLCASVAATTTLLERKLNGSRRQFGSRGGGRNKERGEGSCGAVPRRTARRVSRPARRASRRVSRLSRRLSRRV